MRLISFDLVMFLREQAKWSEETFGPGDRTEGVIDHIRKELTEIEDADLMSEREDRRQAKLAEFIDVVILALDGCWRVGFTPEEIAMALNRKFERNKARTWPDWRTVPLGKAIEHDRSKGDG